MNKLTSIQIKQKDGTYSEKYPISVLAENVIWEQGQSNSLVDILGQVQHQIDVLDNKKFNTSDLNTYLASQISTDVTNWLSNNVNPVGSAVTVDQSLTTSGSAADSKIVGDNITDLKRTLDNINIYAFNNIRNIVNFTVADITSQAGDNYGKLGRVKYRISSTNILKFDEDITINIDEGYKFCYYRYESTDSETAIERSATSWFKDTTVVPSDICFRLQVARDTENASEVITDPINNDLYNALLITVNKNKESSIPDHWKSEIVAKETTINSANESIGGNGVSFVFITDYHQNSSNHVSTSLIKHIFDNTSVDTMIYGGDTTDGIGTTAQCLAKIREYANKNKQFNCLNVRGNHDCEPTAQQTINQISDTQYYDACVRSIEKVTNTGGKIYYHFDNVSQKVRYIILDSGGMINPLDATQLGWLKDRLTELGEGWTVFIFQHYVINQSPNTQTIYLADRGRAVLNAIGEVYTTLNCTIAAYICGHAHVDGMLNTNYNFKIIATTCDSGGGNAAYDWVNPIRPKGTTNDCAFDVFSVDTAHKTIAITRVGAGTDRSVTY